MPPCREPTVRDNKAFTQVICLNRTHLGEDIHAGYGLGLVTSPAPHRHPSRPRGGNGRGVSSRAKCRGTVRSGPGWSPHKPSRSEQTDNPSPAQLRARDGKANAGSRAPTTGPGGRPKTDALRSCDRAGSLSLDSRRRLDEDLTQVGKAPTQEARANDQHDFPTGRKRRRVGPEKFPGQTLGPVAIDGQAQRLLGRDDGEPGGATALGPLEIQRKGPQSSREPVLRMRAKSAEARIRRSRGRRMGLTRRRGAYDRCCDAWREPCGHRQS